MECCKTITRTIQEKIALLDDCPSELYINFCLKFGEAYGYFALSQILVIYLHEEYGISDIQAGAIYGFWGVCITFCGFITSCFNDYFGVRRSLLVGFTISMVANICLALNTNLIVFYIVLFGILPIGNSIGIPMLTVGIKRYTTRKNRGFAFGLFYSVMNIAALVSGPVVDFFNVIVCPSHSSCSSTYRYDQLQQSQSSEGGGSSGNSTAGVSKETDGGPTRLITGNRLVIWSIVVVYFCSFWVTFLYLREIRVDDKDDEEEEEDGGGGGGSGGEMEMIEEGVNGTEPKDEADTSRIGTDSSHKLLPESSSIRTDSNDSYEKQAATIIHRKRMNKPSDSSSSNTVSVYSSLHILDNQHNSPKHQSEKEANGEIEVTLSPIVSSNRNEIHDHKSNRDTLQYSRIHFQDDMEEPNTPTNLSTVDSSSIGMSSPPKITSIYTFVWEILSSPTFWRFCLLTLFLINLNTIFRHLDATLPTYLLRCFGPNYPKGMIYSINPLMIIWLTPTVAAFTSLWPHFDMIKYGGYVSAISPFFLAFSTSTWAAVMFMIVLSLGEAIWSPRLYDYTMSIAPEGREASFSALAALPLFAAKIPVGLLSGYLLHTYMPEGQSQQEDQRQGKKLWLIIGLLTLSSPILITLCERCIREPEKKTRARTAKQLAGNVTSDSFTNPLQSGKPIFTILSDDEEEEEEDQEGGFKDKSKQKLFVRKQNVDLQDQDEKISSQLEFERIEVKGSPALPAGQPKEIHEQKTRRTFSI